MKDLCIKAYLELQDKAVQSNEDSLTLVDTPEEIVGYYLCTYGDGAYTAWYNNGLLIEGKLSDRDNKVMEIFNNIIKDDNCGHREHKEED